ncbi:MAG: hypothetical protein CSA38_01360 [Flavobacteriales bacterium]|nr:MAG: hypothetical protein CSA38_01360 [Flavobacteriales bacterium]
MFDFIFIILTYRNYEDLDSFFRNNKIPNSRVVVVNSFYDEETKKEFQRIAQENNADFINIENKGYGYGNNQGIAHALQYYDFKYIVVANADVKIKKLNTEFLLSQDNNAIYAPEIKTLTGKHQNPFIINYSYFFRWLYYVAVKQNINFLKYIVYATNGVVRRLFIKLVQIFKLKKSRVYSCHGCFYLMGKEALLKLHPLYNEEMFLYNEEHFLAKKAKQNGVKVYYIPFDVAIEHFEDGSQDFSDEKSLEYSRDSYMKYFEYFKTKTNG